ncbi:MAG: HEAT repeat domain-containing protein [Phycisphaeraceae bacterium]|nr:HEAT repeat domain-containing protein [Phycisphaeraceae bacterium]
MGPSPLPFLLAAAALALAGVAVILWWLLLADRRGRRLRRCPGCWYDLSDTPGLTCPECGRTAKSERATHRRHRRRRWLVLALVLLAAALALALVPRVRARGWYGLVPTTALIAAIPYVDPPPSHFQNELYERLDEGPIPIWQRRYLFGRCDAVLRESQDSNTRIHALRVIEHIAWRHGHSGRPTHEASEAGPILARVIAEDSAVAVRGFAAGIISTCEAEPAVAVPALARCVESDPDGSVRRSAVRSLTHYHEHAAAAVPAVLACIAFQGTPYLERDATALLGRIGPDPGGAALAALRSRLGSEDAEVRGAAATAIGRFAGEGRPAIPDLVAALRDPDSGVRKFSAQALEKVGEADLRVIEALLDTLYDGADHVRYQALISLLVLTRGEPPALDRIATRMDTWQPSASRAGVLLAHGAGARVAGLERYVADSLREADTSNPRAWEARFDSFKFLCEVGYADTSLLGLIEPRTRDPVDRVQVWAVLLTAQLQGDRVAAVPRLVEIIRRNLNPAKFYPRGDAAEALALIGPPAAAADPEVIGLLESMLKEDAWHSREGARKALRAITGRDYGQPGEPEP